MSDEPTDVGDRDDPLDGEFIAVLDRFEGDRAVLLLERDAETVGDLTVDRERLPPEAREQDAVLRVVVADGRLREAAYDAGETDRRSERMRSRFDRLARRRRDDGDDTADERSPDQRGSDDRDPLDDEGS
jgi:hypothetical protein